MRRQRLDLPGTPLHITHRGVNRGATFIDDEDFAAYLQALEKTSREQGVSIHGYVLMTNHVHLLVSAEVVGAVSRMMQALGRRYVRAFNARYGRTGTLWEGRYKFCLIDSNRYLWRAWKNTGQSRLFSNDGQASSGQNKNKGQSRLFSDAGQAEAV